MKNLIKIFFLLAFVVFFPALGLEAQESTTTPETATTTTETISLSEEVQAAIDAQANLSVEINDFSVGFSPSHPGPNEKVSAQIISYTFDVNQASVAWILNGKIAGSGKSFSFNTAGLGSKTEIQVSVITPDQKTLSKYFSFQAAEVDLIWETPGYAPAQYRGKILPVPQSSIKVIAFTQGFNISASQLTYEWKRDDKNIPNSSGRNRRTFSFYAEDTGEENIEVKVSTADGKAVAENGVSIKIGSPEILFYEESSEGPQYQKELGNNFSLRKEEFSLRAEPLFFSRRALALANFSYDWRMNNKAMEKPEKPNLINLSIPEGEKEGSSLIKLFLQNPLNVVEMASKELQIDFNIE